MMRAVGLIPSHTGEPGGREVGQKVSHYIEKGVIAKSVPNPTLRLVHERRRGF